MKTKTAAKHTPGPWEIAKETCCAQVVITKGGDTRLMNFFAVAQEGFCAGGGVALVDDEANARLIAAAPDLFDIAEGLLGLSLMDKLHKPEEILILLDRWADKARAAIAKAEVK